MAATIRPPSSFSIDAQNPPSYAFPGAYANYNVTVSGFLVHGFAYSTSADYAVSGVDSSSRALTVQYNFGGELAYLSSATVASFDAPAPLPAVSASDLTALDHGNLPADMIVPTNTTEDPPSATLITNTTVLVPAGTFTVDQITLANGNSEWVAVNSGLIVRENGLLPGPLLPAGLHPRMVLTGTNIPGGGVPGYKLLYIANAVTLVVVASVVALVLLRGRVRKRPGR